MYKTIENTYNVTTKHPAGYKDGTHSITVITQLKNNNLLNRYAKGSGFGCSRDYMTRDDEKCLQLFLSEHAMTIIRIEQTSTRSY